MPYRRVKARLSQTDTWLLELFLGFYSLVWGLNIANPMTDAFLNSPRTYALLSNVPGGEPVLGACMAVVGGAVLMATIAAHRLTRAVVMGTAGIAWLLVAVAIGVPTGWTGGMTLMLVAFSHWFCWARLRFRGDA